MFLRGNGIFDHKPDLPDGKTNGKKPAGKGTLKPIENTTV